jgi:plastocyanin
MSLSPTKLAAGAVFATALLVACTKTSDPSGNVGAGPVRGDAERIVIVDRAFEPKILELTAGEEVVIEVTNGDGGAHDFAIDSLDLNTGNIEPGEVATATFAVPEGTTKFRCTYHDGMEGRIEAR